DPARSQKHYGPHAAGSAGDRSSRARFRSGREALAGLPRRGTRHVLVAGLVGIRLHSMVPPQSRLPLREMSGARRAVGLTIVVAALAAVLMLGSERGKPGV